MAAAGVYAEGQLALVAVADLHMESDPQAAAHMVAHNQLAVAEHICSDRHIGVGAAAGLGEGLDKLSRSLGEIQVQERCTQGIQTDHTLLDPIRNLED